MRTFKYIGSLRTVGAALFVAHYQLHRLELRRCDLLYFA